MTPAFATPHRNRIPGCHLAVVVALAWSAATTALCHAQPQLPELLPAPEVRQVIGTWRLVEPDIPCTRSIERIDAKYFMVARCSDNPTADGSRGLPITRLGERIFRGQSGQRYEIQSDGRLFMFDGQHVSMKAKPQADLWPR